MSDLWKRRAALFVMLVVWPYLAIGSVLAWSIWPMHEGREASFRARATAMVVTQWPKFLNQQTTPTATPADAVEGEGS